MRMIVPGYFGVRIVWASCVERLVAGRRVASIAAADDVAGSAAPDLAERLRALSPERVIRCAGRFQGEDYRVAAAVLAGGHDLSMLHLRRFDGAPRERLAS
jgi:hypothetical protein